MACHKPKGAVGALRATKHLLVVLVGLAATIACLGAPLVPASAGPLQTARARATALVVQAEREARLVHDLTLRYEDDAAQAGFWREQAARADAAARSLKSRSATTGALLQEEAVLSYADSVPSVSPAAGQSAADFVESADREAYLTAAVGDLSTTLAQFNAERSGLVATIAAAKKDLRGVLAAEGLAAAARREALGEAASLQTMLSQTRSQIAALSAHQRASTGPPVGNGIVKALATQLGTPPPAASGPVTTTTSAVVRAPLATTSSTKATTSTTRATTTTTRATTTTTRATTTSATRATTTTSATKKKPATTKSTAATAPLPPGVTTRVTAAATTTARSTIPAGSSTTAPTTTTAAPATTSGPPSTTSTTESPSTPTTADPPALAPTTATTPAPPASPAGGVWLELRECESGNNYQADTGNGYYGAYQFSVSTWSDLGYPGRPDQEPYWMQDAAAQRLEAAQGWAQWPSCGAALGL